MSDVVTINVGLILLIAVVVAMISRRMRLPYSVGLVAAGVLLAQVPIVSGVLLSPEGIYTILLPPLVFEAALQIRWSPFRRDLPVILTLAFAGVAVAAATVAAGIHFLVGWSWIGALLFGVLIAATDPVSVIAAFKEMPVAARLGLLVEAESLLNDGAAAVGFAVLLAVAGGWTYATNISSCGAACGVRSAWFWP
jgi:CPA1 family monovalent cation:H+ antiporter